MSLQLEGRVKGSPARSELAIILHVSLGRYQKPPQENHHKKERWS